MGKNTQNAIILWNYLYLTKILMECKKPKEKKKILKAIENKSIIAWQHINLHGEYDFTKTNKNSLGSSLSEILEFEVGRH
ncbi:Tn3 family transposase [Pseudomonadota bacterium]